MTPNPEPEPYVGPRAFGNDDADRFFGRSRESWDLTYSGVLSRRLVVVTGPAGIGKTSLVQAGVLATIRPAAARVLPVVHLDQVGGRRCTRANPFVNAVLAAWSDVREVGAPATLGALVQDLAAGEPRLVVAVLDGFDAVFADDNSAHSDRFVEELGLAMEETAHLHLVVTIRSDVVDRLAGFEAKFAGGDGWRYLLAPLSPGAALDALRRPLLPTGRSFAPGAAERLVRELRSTTLVGEEGGEREVVAPTVEPSTLQIVGRELWRVWPTSVPEIGEQELHEVGDVETLLAAYCLRAVIDVAVESGQPMGALWEWLEATFVTDLGTRGSAYEGLRDTAGMPREVARGFERHHLLRSVQRASAVWFELPDDLFVVAVRRGRRFADDLAMVSGSSRSSDPHDALLVMAEAALVSGRFADAEHYARGAIRASQADARRLAEAHSFLGELVLDQARRATGGRVETYHAIARSSLEAAAALHEAGQNRSGSGLALALLGRLHLERGEHSEALAKLRLALDRVEGRSLSVRVDFARALRSTGQQQAALGEYTRVLHDDSRTVEALVGRGTLSAERGSATAALRDLDAAVRIEPGVADREDVIRARRQAVARINRKLSPEEVG